MTTQILMSVYPRMMRQEFETLLAYCKIRKPLAGFLFLLLVGCVISAGVLTLLLRLFVDYSFILLFIGFFLLSHGVVFTYLVLSADARARFVEELLPDVLQLMSANLRAGMTIDRALLLAARPEFGEFQDEIIRVGTEIATGKEFEAALTDLGKRYRSEKLKKTIRLVVSGVASGGQLAALLEQTAGNLRQQRLIEERVRSGVLVYVIFIFSAIGFGAPMLFGLSSFLIEVITKIFAQVQLPPSTTQIPLKFSKVSISPEFVNTYTIVVMIMTSIMGSLILGLIAKGKEKEGLKFLPVLIIMTISLFFLIKYIIANLLSGLFQF